jgi:large subunit ribosomal protein L17
MRHLKKGKKFNRLRGPRISFIRNLANDVIRAESVETTEVRAKAIKPVVEKLVTIAKQQTLASRRLIISRVHVPAIEKKLFEVLGPRYAERKGGYLRITKLQKARKRDGTRMARIEFVEGKIAVPVEKKTKSAGGVEKKKKADTIQETKTVAAPEEEAAAVTETEE